MFLIELILGKIQKRSQQNDEAQNVDRKPKKLIKVKNAKIYPIVEVHSEQELHQFAEFTFDDEQRLKIVEPDNNQQRGRILDVISIENEVKIKNNSVTVFKVNKLAEKCKTQEIQVEDIEAIEVDVNYQKSNRTQRY